MSTFYRHEFFEKLVSSYKSSNRIGCLHVYLQIMKGYYEVKSIHKIPQTTLNIQLSAPPPENVELKFLYSVIKLYIECSVHWFHDVQCS